MPDHPLSITRFEIINHAPTLDNLHEDIKQEDTEQTALSLIQLIEQQGLYGWLDAALKKLGPNSMLQLEDMGNALEIMRKQAGDIEPLIFKGRH